MEKIYCRKGINMEKVYCINCIRWYSTGTDQCDIPSCGIPMEDRFSRNKDFDKAISKEAGKINKEGQEFIKNHMECIYSCTNKKIFGHPSELNINNDCYFYKALPKWLRWLTPIVRSFY